MSLGQTTLKEKSKGILKLVLPQRLKIRSICGELFNNSEKQSFDYIMCDQLVFNKSAYKKKNKTGQDKLYSFDQFCNDEHVR